MHKILKIILFSVPFATSPFFQAQGMEPQKSHVDVFNKRKAKNPQELKVLIANALDAIAQEYYDKKNYPLTKKQWGDFLFNLSEKLTKEEMKVASDVLNEICSAGAFGEGDETRASIRLSLAGLTDNNSREETELAVQVCNRHKLLQEKISAPEPITLQSATIDQFNDLPSTDVLAEFQAITPTDLFQTSEGGACILYSFLWSVHENPDLKKKLAANIKKFNGRYYIKNPITKKIYVITQENIQSVHSSLHPSANPLLRAIGIYTLAALKDYLGGNISEEHFILNIEGKDLFFGQNIIELNHQRDDRLKLNPDGTVTIFNAEARESKKISGNFVISVAGKKHAQAVYFDKNKGDWLQINNQAVLPKDVAPFSVNQVAYPGMTIIGFIQSHKVN